MQEPQPPTPAVSVPARGPTPWERRGELGLVSGFWQTFRDSLFQPHLFWPSLDPKGNLIDALLYGWLNTVLYSGPGLLFGYVSLKLQLPTMSKSFNDLNSPAARQVLDWVQDHAGLFMVVMMLASLTLYPLGQIITAGLLHLFCLITGCAKNGFNATFRVVAYTQGTRLLEWIPCLGSIVALYQLWLIALGLSKSQDSTIGRAVAAVLLPVALIFVCGCGCAALAFVAGVAGAAK
ncbi:MAG: YIP1 family protein [Myxococcaceae bacterium]